MLFQKMNNKFITLHKFHKQLLFPKIKR